MPRSYSFEHFKVGQHSQGRSLRARDQAQLHAAHGAQQTHGIHYGPQHPQTEELIHAHQMETQFEELAGLPKAEPEAAPARVDAKASAPRGAPIGAMPAPLEPPTTLGMKDFLGDGERYWRTLRMAARELLSAGSHLVLLPWQAARFAAQRWVRG